MKILWLTCGVFFSLTVFAATPKSSVVDKLSPKQVCRLLFEIPNGGISKRREDIKNWTFEGARAARAHSEWINQRINHAICGREIIAGDHAMVLTRIGKQQCFVPFVKSNGRWKLDLQGFRILYRMNHRLEGHR